MNWISTFGVINVILTLIVLFQWLDRRSKNRWLENTFHALREMSKRAATLSDKQAVKQKSDDLISVIDGAIRTIDGSKKAIEPDNTQ